MIRKFLICGKQQLYIQQQVLDGYNEIGKVIELAMPIRDFWRLEEEIKEVNYLLSAGESNSEITSSYKKALRICAKYALREDDRQWLFTHAGN